jgi:hypothetical protein
LAAPSCPAVDERIAHLADDGTRILTLEFCSREEAKKVRAWWRGEGGEKTH